MATVAHITEKLIREKPFLQDALLRGIINHAALAEEFIPLIEKELHEKAKFSAVNMAIRRYAEKLPKQQLSQVHFDPNTDLTVKTNLAEITIYKLEDFEQYIKKIYDLIDFKSGDFLTITQGLHELMIITNEKNIQKITSIFPKKHIKKTIKNLSSITLTLPAHAYQTAGFFYLVTRELNWENINIVDIVSTFTEMTFIIDTKDVPRAFDILKKLIEKGKTSPAK